MERKEAEAERKTASENAVNNANTAATNAQAVADTLTQKLASGDYDGEDGLTPYIGANGNWWIGKVDTGNPSRGANGTDGVSATHSWNGTVLTIKSASGSSSADLKDPLGLLVALYHSRFEIHASAVVEGLRVHGEHLYPRRAEGVGEGVLVVHLVIHIGVYDAFFHSVRADIVEYFVNIHAFVRFFDLICNTFYGLAQIFACQHMRQGVIHGDNNIKFFRKDFRQCAKIGICKANINIGVCCPHFRFGDFAVADV